MDLLEFDNKEPDRGVTIAEAGEILGYSSSTIRRMIKKGELIAYGRHKKKRIHLSSIIAYQQLSRAAVEIESEEIRQIKRVSKRHSIAMKQLEELMK
jgi:excisionase family DNA binding protein